MKIIYYLILIFISIFNNLYSYQLNNIKNIELDSTSLFANIDGNLYSLNRVSNDKFYIYKKPRLRDPFIGTFKTFNDFFSLKFNALSVGVLTFSTLFLVRYDQNITDKAQQFGNYIGLEGSNNVYNILPFDYVPIYVPTDLPSALYYLGDGLTHIYLTLGIGIYGKITHSSRAVSTSFQLAQGLMVAGLYSQVIKHITGRQSPFTATEPGGKWNLFPNQIEYHKHVPHYDAFPSGHVAATMMTITILAENYPENRYIRPVGYGLMSLLMYQMLNNGVHWASDYPFSIVVSSVLAKIIVANSRAEVYKKGKDYSVKANLKVFPIFKSSGEKGLLFGFNF